MKWGKLIVGIGIALLVSGVAFGGTTQEAATGTMKFNRFLNVYAPPGGNWHGGNFTISQYGGVFKVDNVLAIDFEVGGKWRILAQASVSGGTDALAVLRAFEIGLNDAQGHWYASDGVHYGPCDFTYQGQWMNLLGDDRSVDENEDDPLLFFAWNTNDLTGCNIGGHTYSFTVTFKLVSP